MLLCCQSHWISLFDFDELCVFIYIFDWSVFNRLIISSFMYVSIVDIYLHFDFVVIFAAFLSVFLSIQEKLTRFRLKELKDVLNQLGLSKQGKKQVGFGFFFPYNWKQYQDSTSRKKKRKQYQIILSKRVRKCQITFAPYQYANATSYMFSFLFFNILLHFKQKKNGQYWSGTVAVLNGTYQFMARTMLFC